MFLYLIRHGEAKSKNEDPERGLTDHGVNEAKRSAKFLASSIKADWGPSFVCSIWHSDKKRAIQTAEIIAGAVNFSGSPQYREGLNPTDDIDSIVKAIDCMGPGTIVVVGHLPFLSRLAGFLLCGSRDNEFADIKTAGILCLQGSGRYWNLEWMAHPGILE